MRKLTPVFAGLVTLAMALAAEAGHVVAGPAPSDFKDGKVAITTAAEKHTFFPEDPAGLLGGLGLVMLGVGMVLLAMLPAEPSVMDIVWRMAVCGCGFGFFQSPNMKAIMSSAPPGRSGGASGLVATARLVGQTTGAALAALCFGLAGHGGATLALALGAGFAALGSVMSFLRLVATPRPK